MHHYLCRVLPIITGQCRGWLTNISLRSSFYLPPCKQPFQAQWPWPDGYQGPYHDTTKSCSQEPHRCSELACSQGVVLCKLVAFGNVESPAECVQRNALHWECIDPPGESLDYVSNLMQASGYEGVDHFGGVIEQVAVATLPTAPQPMAPSNSESRLGPLMLNSLSSQGHP